MKFNMSHSPTFADSEFNGKRRKTRKEIFLAAMGALLPWPKMLGVIADSSHPHYAGTMLRIHCMQPWCNLCDGAMKDALDKMTSMVFLANHSPNQTIPDRNTIINFHHLLAQHQPARQLFGTVNLWFSDAGIMIKKDTLVEATIIKAHGSLRTKGKERDPEMHRTHKGNRYHLGMQTNIDLDTKSGVTHHQKTTPVNKHDLYQVGNLHHSEDFLILCKESTLYINPVIKI
ncbi:MAG: transposase [Aeromonas sp.]